MTQKEQERKVFVRGLPPVVSPERLKAFFSYFGPIQDCQLRIHPKSNLCMGQVTVTFMNKKTAQNLFGRKILFEGHSLECNQFFSGEDLKKRIKLENRLKLLIFGLPPDMTSLELAAGMNFYQGVKDAYVVLEHRLSTRNKGYGVLVFRSEPYKLVFLKLAKDMKLTIQGNQLSISDNLSDPRKNKQTSNQKNPEVCDSHIAKDLSTSRPLTPNTGVNESPKAKGTSKFKSSWMPSRPADGPSNLGGSEKLDKSTSKDRRKLSDKAKTTKGKIIEASRVLPSSSDNYRFNGLSTRSEVFFNCYNKPSAVSGA